MNLYRQTMGKLKSLFFQVIVENELINDISNIICILLKFKAKKLTPHQEAFRYSSKEVEICAIICNR